MNEFHQIFFLYNQLCLIKDINQSKRVINEIQKKVKENGKRGMSYYISLLLSKRYTLFFSLLL